MEQLPNEILEEIFCRSSVKCLLSFRCVSKSWLAVNSSPYFIKLHLNRSFQRNSNLMLFQKKNDFFQVDFDSLHDSDAIEAVKVYSIPVTFRFYGFKLSSSCDGLLCMSPDTKAEIVDLFNPSTRRNNGLATSCLGDMIKIRAIENVFLWNPSTMKYTKLPYASIEIANQFDHLCAYADCIYRIGYDDINDDYKVVRMVMFTNDSSNSFIDYDINVYSLKSNSWHRPKKFPQCLNSIRIGNSIAGGALHWISTLKSDLKNERLIVAFDFRTEKYRVIPRPEYSCPHYVSYLYNLGGCLSLTCQLESSIVDVFLLKEYGGKNEHWSRLVRLSPTTTLEIYHPLKPLVYSNSGKKVWLNMGSWRFVLYDLEQNSVEKIMIYDKRRLTGSLHTCFESLVSVECSSSGT